MYRTLKANYLRVHRSFRNSAVILLARFNVALGALWYVLLQTDPHTLAVYWHGFSDPRVTTGWVILNGFLSEYARRRPGSLEPLSPVEPYQPSDSPCK